jgi:hypothetical protein
LDSNEPDTNASHTPRSIPTATASSSDTGHTSPTSGTSPPSTPTSSPTQTSGAAGSPVSPSPWLARVLETLTNAICGPHSPSWWPLFVLRGSYWKTSQDFSLFDVGTDDCTSSSRSSVDLPHSGIASAGRCWALTMPERPTAGAVSGSSPTLWPTADRSVANLGEGPETWLRRKEHHASKEEDATRAGIPLAIAVQLWPTPTQGDCKASGSRNTATSQAHPGVSLTDAVRQDGGTGRLWATPKSSPSGADYARAGRPESGGDDLATQVQRNWSTPAARDGAHNKGRGWDLPRHVDQGPAGQLNPEFVEALMGFPISWTETQDGPRVQGKSSTRGSRRASRTRSRTAGSD